MNIGVFLLNMGGPQRLADIQPFLRLLLQDPNIVPLPGPPIFQRLFARMISQLRAGKVRAQYQAIGGGSPLNTITARQCAALETQLNKAGPHTWRVRPGLRYIPAVTLASSREFAAFNPDTLVFLPLYQFYSFATSHTSLADAHQALNQTMAAHRAEVVEIPDWHDFPLMIEWTVREITSVLNSEEFLPRQTVVLFSAHGLPASFIRKGDPYRHQIGQAYSAISARLTGWRTELAFQSRVGPTRWLKPYTTKVIGQLAAEGVEELLLVPLGFSAENVETLYEMDHLYRERALSAGIRRFARFPCPNDDPAFIEILQTLIQQRIS